MSRKMSLISFDASNDLSVFADLLFSEMNFLFSEMLPQKVLFIPYGYDKACYSSYIQQVIKVFGSFNVGVKIITDGNPTDMIKEAPCIVVGGGSLEKILEGVASYASFLAVALKNGKPFLGWNEGAVLPCPAYLLPALLPIYPKCLGVTPLQIYPLYCDSDVNRFDIKNFLINHKNDVPPITSVVCLSGGPGGSGIRLEDDIIKVNFAGGSPANPNLQFTLGPGDHLIIQ